MEQTCKNCEKEKDCVNYQARVSVGFGDLICPCGKWEERKEIKNETIRGEE